MKKDSVNKRFIKTAGWGSHPDSTVGVSLTSTSSGSGLALRVNDGVGWGEIVLTPAQAQELGSWLKEDAEPQP